MKQKGQDIVEFALLLPLFMLLLYGMMYASFFFSDYMTISGIVRSAAREAAVVSQFDQNGRPDGDGIYPSNYDAIAKRYDKVLAETQMITHLYMPQGVTVKATGANPTNGEPAGAVRASVTMKLTDNVLLITAMRNRGMGFILDGYEIDYYMHSEIENDN